MGSDLFALSVLAKELNEQLQGARIDKIQQPEVDELRFFVRAKGKNQCLVISCNAGAPRIHFTQSRKQSPQVAPNLCMLLRKHLLNATIEGVTIYNQDRIIGIKFRAKTELRDEKIFYLFVELMNRYSNIVFTDENLLILDAVKHLPLDIARDHVVLRGVAYAPVKQHKISYLSAQIDIFKAFNGGDLHRFIQDNISGFSGGTIEELLSRCNLLSNVPSLSEKDAQNIIKGIENFASLSGDNPNVKLEPCIINGKEVYPLVYRTIAKSDLSNVQFFPTMSEAYDALTTDSDKDIRNKARLKGLAVTVKHLRVRAEKNIAGDLEKLKECEDMDKYRLYGELIVSYIYLIKKGDTSLKCVNYYNNQEIEIPLDVRLSPSKNSTAYYTKYNKLKRTQEFVSKKLVKDKALLEYLKSIEEEIANLPYESDTSAIEQELDNLGAGKKKSAKGKVRKEKAEPPFIYYVDDFYIYRGKNNLQNDELTFKIASSNDVWLHLKNEHGSHVIIETNGRVVPDHVLKIAGEITACTKQATCEVDYTQRRNVKRKPDGHPGQVIYVNYKTLVAEPNPHKELEVKK